MEHTFTTIITNLERQTASGQVLRVFFTINLTTEGESASHSGYLDLLPAEPDSDGYVAYEQLTAETVLGWLESQHSYNLQKIKLEMSEESNINIGTTIDTPWE